MTLVNRPLKVFRFALANARNARSLASGRSAGTAVLRIDEAGANTVGGELGARITRLLILLSSGVSAAAVEAALAAVWPVFPAVQRAVILLRADGRHGLLEPLMAAHRACRLRVAEVTVKVWPLVTNADVGQRPTIRDRLSHILAEVNGAGDLRAEFVLLVDSTNAYVADDVVQFFRRERNRALAVVPGREYQQEPLVAGDRESFHVRMMFGGFSRQRQFSYCWRNYFRRFANGQPVAGSDRLFPVGSPGGSPRAPLPVASPGSTGGVHGHANGGLAIPELFLQRSIEPPLAVGEIIQVGRDAAAARWRRNRAVPAAPAAIRARVEPERASPSQWRRVVITGWYGTETHGDKAILGEVLHFLKTFSPQCEIVVTTICRPISEQTNTELADLAHSGIVELGESYRPEQLEGVDAVILGGGPLMDTAEMVHVLRLFREAARQRKARVIFGCGIGPIHGAEMRTMIAEIVQLATAGFVRDQASHHFADRLHAGHVLSHACDPAVAFINRWRLHHRIERPAEPYVATMLRSNTAEFHTKREPVGVEELNQRAARQIATGLQRASGSTAVRLLHMNSHWIGGDDRLFNREVEQLCGEPARIHAVRTYLTLEDQIRALAGADAAIAMRYHGHVFSLALGIPFLSIDYTGAQGKVASLVGRIGYTQWSEGWGEIDPDRMATRLQALRAERERWSRHLVQETEELVARLRVVYGSVFGVSGSVLNNIDKK